MMRKNLQLARTAKGLTQEAIAEYLGVATNHYQRIEYGQCDTIGENWLRLFELFGETVSLHQLMEDTPKPGKPKPAT